MNRSLWKFAAAGGLGLTAALFAHRLRQRADISGQTVLITGGSRGLGLALALEFARFDCRLAICARDREQLAQAQSLLREQGATVFACQCDVSDAAQVAAMMERVRDYYGQVDILVNNAGEILVAPMENTTIGDYERAMAVMFWGVLNMTFAVLPEMRERGHGRIANITSLGGLITVPHLMAYSCAKAAAVAFSEGLREEMGPHGVHVTTIAPGLMRTGGHVNARFKGQAEDEAAWFKVAASAPLISTSAERIARQTVDAIRRGASMRVLPVEADLIARLHGAFPELVPGILSLISRALPGPTPDSSREVKGMDMEKEQGNALQLLTTLGRRAGARLNQSAQPGESPA